MASMILPRQLERHTWDCHWSGRIDRLVKNITPHDDEMGT
jgi:hypothetical protein